MLVQSGRPWNDPHCDYSSFPSTRGAAAQAYRRAGIAAKEIDVAEAHDCFTWTELTNYEGLGYCGRGGAPEIIREGRTRLDGDLPVNTSSNPAVIRSEPAACAWSTKS